MAPHKLHLRKVHLSGPELLRGSECDNIFTEEFCLLFDLVTPCQDTAVIEIVGDDMPIIPKQERQHANMHESNQSAASRQEGRGRWAWFLKPVQLVLLEGRLGREVRKACAGCFEAASGPFFYLPAALPFVRGFMTNALAFHAWEEVEHGPLTTRCIGSRMSRFMVLPTFVPMVIFFWILLLMPPVVLLMARPKLLLRPKSFTDLALYYLAFVPTFLSTITVCIVFWLLPFKGSGVVQAKRYAFFRDMVKARGIRFEVLDEHTYEID